MIGEGLLTLWYLKNQNITCEVRQGSLPPHLSDQNLLLLNSCTMYCLECQDLGDTGSNPTLARNLLYDLESL